MFVSYFGILFEHVFFSDKLTAFISFLQRAILYSRFLAKH